MNSLIRLTSLSVNSARTALATWNRLAAVQASPPLRILAWIAPSTAASRSASSNTTNGALPPSSSDSRSSWSEACLARARPTPVEPVKVSLRIRPSSSSAVVSAPGSLVGSTDSTPLGSPASSISWASSSMVSGVSCAGLTTMVLPAASAGPILRVPIASGKFHGVMARHGPTGALVTTMRPPPAGLGA
ncbi:hypothetical protein C1Y40_05812 [Mycobacterium talmoniae]|uniref:Uncharacterized protein n=1 Tax=Mycobacterium talmoniae TaxID=1858794 RepID=A0A2S8BBK1_9MYCO|nr:hypothetical protein C1Y40_05812 [Mycobacterium talmoniae]